MFPEYDPVCVLRVKPFSRLNNDHKNDVLAYDRPKPNLNISKIVKAGKSAPYNRNFKVGWYEQYQWLCGSFYLKKLFCWPCILLSNKVSVWNHIGFDDLLNGTRAMRCHEGSSEHLKTEFGLKQLRKSTFTIVDVLQQNSRLYVLKFNESVRLNRQFMELPIEVVLYLGKQGFEFRGHDESAESSNKSNFKELLTSFVNRSSPEIRNQYEKCKTVFCAESKTIQNELVSCIDDYIAEYITNELGQAPFYSVQVDDTTAQKSQCSVIVRYVNPSGGLVERFFGFYDVSEDRTAAALFKLIDSVLQPHNYDTKLIAQCYDGASVRSGHLNGLQIKIKEVAPQAMLVHCLAHRLSLVLQQSVENICKCRIFFANVNGIPAFFHRSANRTFELDSVTGRLVPTVGDTRWTSNSKILDVINADWDDLKEAFEKIMNDPTSDQASIRQSQGFLKQFSDFEFTYLVLVFDKIFGSTTVLFDVLQKNSFSIDYCLSQIKIVIEKLKSMRNKMHASEIFETTLSRAEIVQPIRTVTDNEMLDEMFQIYEQLYYEILDTICVQMEARFQDFEKMYFVSLADSSKFSEHARKFPNEALDNFKQSYPNVLSYLEIQRLKNELQIVYADPQYRAKKLEDVVKALHENKEIFKETYKLFCLILTIPSSSSSVERSFSCLKRVKTYLRNSISQERFCSLSRISIEKELLTELQSTNPFFEDIIDKFASLENRKIDLIYKK